MDFKGWQALLLLAFACLNETPTGATATSGPGSRRHGGPQPRIGTRPLRPLPAFRPSSRGIPSKDNVRVGHVDARSTSIMMQQRLGERTNMHQAFKHQQEPKACVRSQMDRCAGDASHHLRKPNGQMGRAPIITTQRPLPGSLRELKRRRRQFVHLPAQKQRFVSPWQHQQHQQQQSFGAQRHFPVSSARKEARKIVVAPTIHVASLVNGHLTGRTIKQTSLADANLDSLLPNSNEDAFPRSRRQLETRGEQLQILEEIDNKQSGAGIKAPEIDQKRNRVSKTEGKQEVILQSNKLEEGPGDKDVDMKQHPSPHPAKKEAKDNPTTIEKQSQEDVKKPTKKPLNTATALPKKQNLDGNANLHVESEKLQQGVEKQEQSELLLMQKMLQVEAEELMRQNEMLKRQQDQFESKQQRQRQEQQNEDDQKLGFKETLEKQLKEKVMLRVTRTLIEHRQRQLEENNKMLEEISRQREMLRRLRTSGRQQLDKVMLKHNQDDKSADGVETDKDLTKTSVQVGHREELRSMKTEEVDKEQPK